MIVSAEANMSEANVRRAIASGRSQDCQQADGSVKVPEVLRPYMAGMTSLNGG